MSLSLHDLMDGLQREGIAQKPPGRSNEPRFGQKPAAPEVPPWLAEYRASSFAAAWETLGFAVYEGARTLARVVRAVWYLAFGSRGKKEARRK